MTKKIIFVTTIAITLFIAGFLAVTIPNVQANHGELFPGCFIVNEGDPVKVWDPNVGMCVLPEECEFGVDNTANRPHCNSPPTGDDDDDDDDDDDEEDD